MRSHPESRLARELHLSSIESSEQEDKRKMKEAAIGGVTIAAAVGVAAGIASLLLTKRWEIFHTMCVCALYCATFFNR